MSEIFRKLDKPTLTSMKQYSAIERDVLNSLIKPVEQSYSPSNINYFLLRYDTRTDTEIKLKSRTSQVPNDEETRFLLDILTHRYNDFLIPPIMPYLTGDQIITFLNSFFELNSSFRNKTIAGLVPSTLSRDDQLKIIEFYIQKGCNIYVFDLYGSSPDRHYASINMVLSELMDYEKKTRDKTFLMATNVRYGRPHRDTIVAPAKDLLSFYSGFDCFGKAHVQKIVFDTGGDGRPLKKDPSISRLLNIDDYGYHISQSNEIIASKTAYEQSNIIKKIDFKPEQETKISGLLNSVEQGIEASKLRDILSTDGKISNYLSTKRELPDKFVDELKELYREVTAPEVRQSTLF
jgi:hypothetical protein